MLSNIVRGIRQITKPEFIVGLRITANDYMPDGQGADGFADIARRVEAEGLDYVSLSAGCYETMDASAPAVDGALVDSGDIRLLNVWTEKRNKAWPDVPTFKELGYPFVFDSPWGFAGPKGLDRAVVKILHDAFKKAVEDPTVLATMEKHEMLPRYMGPEAYTNFVTDLVAQERAYLDRIGLLKKD